MNKIFTFILSLCILSSVDAQQHVCGVSHQDQQGMIDMIAEFNKRKNDVGYTRSADPVFVPVKMHLVADSDGQGRVSARQALDQFAVVIEDFRKVNMYAYLDDGWFNTIDNTTVYENPGNFENTIVGYKDANAVNIFVTQNANTNGGQGTVLGFYSPSGDYIIIRKTDVEGATSSLSHELGHLFGLPHTFFGWEAGWNPSQFNGQVSVLNAPGTNIPVELVDGSNCTVAADRICDTPPDYNFGFGWNGCDFTDNILDRNGDLIDPLERNYMSYFIGCDPYTFTQGQIDVMFNNYNSPSRANIRKSFIPDTLMISNDYEILEPENNANLEYFNKILLDWEDADNAENYLVTLNDQGGNRTEYRVTESELLLDELDPEIFYFWDVTAYSDGWTKVETKSSFFKSGSDFNTSTKDLANTITNINVYPNPAQIGQQINLAMTLPSSMDMKISVMDISGNMVTNQQQSLHVGRNNLSIDMMDATTGIYILKLESVQGTTYQKIVIQ